VGKLTAADKRKVQKPLLWVGLASITMTFAGLTSGYIVSRGALVAENRWLEFGLPDQFLYATYAILASSLTMILAKKAIKDNNKGLASILMGLTFFLGVAFFQLQIYSAGDLVDRGYNFVGGNTAASWVYAIAGMHWLHVLSGLLVLAFTWFKLAKGSYTAEDHQGLSVASNYWHFLDILWLFLYLFLYFYR
jgi:cytochrome c oxidase subunit 3